MRAARASAWGEGAELDAADDMHALVEVLAPVTVPRPKKKPPRGVTLRRESALPRREWVRVDPRSNRRGRVG